MSGDQIVYGHINGRWVAIKKTIDPKWHERAKGFLDSTANANRQQLCDHLARLLNDVFEEGRDTDS